VKNTDTYRMTKQREVILEELKKCKTHPSADEIFDRVRKRIPRISLGTVYRNLEILSDIGLIKKLDTAGTQKRFDGDLGTHYHVRCTCCGRIMDLPDEEMDSVRVTLPSFSDFDITGFTVEFKGICNCCRTDETPNSSSDAA